MRRSSARIRSNHSPRWWASRPLQRDQVEHLPRLVTGEHPAASLLSDRRGPREVGREECRVALGEQDLAVVGSPVGLDAVEGRLGGVKITGHHRRPGEAGAEPATVGWFGQLERLPVGAHRRGITEGDEKVGAQRHQPGPARAGGVGADGIDEREGVPVGAEGRFGLGGGEQERDGAASLAGLDEVMADPGGGGAEGLEALGGVAMDALPAVRGEVLQQGVAHKLVPEPVASLGGFEDPQRDGLVELGERFVIGQTGQRDELVDVERGAGDRDPL